MAAEQGTNRVTCDSDVAARTTPPGSLNAARDRLAGFSNTWFYPHEIEKARALAETASEAECQAELDRLEAVRDQRLAAWRYSQ